MIVERSVAVSRAVCMASGNASLLGPIPEGITPTGLEDVALDVALDLALHLHGLGLGLGLGVGVGVGVDQIERGLGGTTSGYTCAFQF
eukprot:1357178-Amorphochlora_amoeboformis.AAC.1